MNAPSRSAVSPRVYALVFALALVAGGALAAMIEQPGYTDAYYYYNAAHRLVNGEGLTDPYVWHYLGAPDTLPTPSHTYWMPLQSLLSAGAMALGGASFGAAQIPSVLCYAGLVTLAFWAGNALGGNIRTAWLSGLLVLFGGLFTPFWATTDTFACFGLAGALAVAATATGRAHGAGRGYAAAGAFAALAHLARADGLLLIGVAALIALWPDVRTSWRVRAGHAGLALAAYFVVMAPWFARNLSVIGRPLPTGGTATIWLRGYDELVSYPPSASIDRFLDWGWDNILSSRWEALQSNFGTFVAVETWVVLGPFVLLGLWRLRRHPLAQSAALYALGLHLAMTFVFSYPGYRGGLFHSSSALLPYWAACGVVGLDQATEWAGKQRGWRIRQAKTVFGAGIVVLAAGLSIYALAARLPSLNANAAIYRTLAQDLPHDARLILNDPPALYYHTGLSGVVLPDAPPEIVPELATRYDASHLVLDRNRTVPFDALYRGEADYPFLRLERVYEQATPDDVIQVYSIRLEGADTP
ncbi:MAG: hypothetical protein GX613_01975 [Chloroflexi bacterium]|nr:hypothetical protein [Chloroflexota bacterium]